jgi:hypothetical protein
MVKGKANPIVPIELVDPEPMEQDRVHMSKPYSYRSIGSCGTRSAGHALRDCCPAKLHSLSRAGLL